MESNNNSSKEDELPPLGVRAEGRLRSFGYKKGALVDQGYQAKGPVRRGIQAAKESRRATCPEIWLPPSGERDEAMRVAVRVYGSKNTGKKTLAHQIHHHASTTELEQIHVLSNESEAGGSRIIDFLLNGHQIRMETLLESALETIPFSSHLIVYMVVYSVDSRESFANAAQLLNRITRTKNSGPTSVILIGNKIDLKRNQVVSSMEGRSLAKIYKTGFVEVSALLSVNLNRADDALGGTSTAVFLG